MKFGDLGASIVKPYAISIAPDNSSAEIDLYGEVVKDRPKDEDGNPVEGNYIVETEFLESLKVLEASGAKRIFLRVNSVGGSCFSAIVIYNKLVELKADITARIDGVSMSAAFFIMQAANTIEAFSSSLLMLHTASMCVMGYYNAMDLNKQIGLLEGCDGAMINAIARKTGKSKREVTEALQLETYMTGSEAVERGYADKLVDDEEEIMPVVASADRHTIYAAGREINLPFGYALPDSLDVKTIEALGFSAPRQPKPASAVKPAENYMQPAPQDSINKNTSGGTDHVEIKNIDELKATYPDFMAQVEAAAKSEGAKSERARIQGIEEIANAIGNSDLIANAKFGEKPMNAEQLAFAAMKAQAAIGATVLADLDTDTKKSGAAAVTPTPAGEGELTEDQKAEAFLCGVAKDMKEGK